MKDKILLTLLVSTVLVSCSSVYRSGQTPDDVYYSPTREVVQKKQEDKQEDKTANTDDRYLKMKVRDRARWSRIDDYDYWTDSRYNNHCSCTCNPPSYSYYYGYYPIRYNNWYPYSPFNPVVGYFNPYYVKGNTTATNVRGYSNPSFNNNNYRTNPKTNTTTEGSFLKRVFTSSGTTTDRTERTFSGGSSNTSSSAGGRSGGYNSTGSSSSSGRGGRGN